MNRSAFAPAFALFVCSAVATSTFAQAQTAAPTTPAPAAKAGFVTPLKGEALIQVLPGTSKFDPKTKEVVTTYKLKNVSSAPIAMLKLDEYWYKNQKMVSTDTRRYMQPFRPGDIIEMTTRAPADANPAGWTKNVTFTHANGKVTPKKVDKF
jgi:hypothetical protein